MVFANHQIRLHIAQSLLLLDDPGAVGTVALVTDNQNLPADGRFTNDLRQARRKFDTFVPASGESCSRFDVTILSLATQKYGVLHLPESSRIFIFHKICQRIVEVLLL